MPGQHGLLVEAGPPPCSPVVMIELLQAYASEMLGKPACLVIDRQNHAIYLLEQLQATYVPVKVKIAPTRIRVEG
jgi:hypothetical protein